MALLPILKFPDPHLARRAEPVSVFDDALARLADDLLETMRAAPGVGITAAHCGRSEALTVIALDDALAPLILVNPQILWLSEEKSEATEGSVSMPGFTDSVTRPARCRIAYQTLTGESREMEADGFLSTCIQHEIDQLNGIFWLQRLSRLKRDRLITKWRKSR